MAWTEEDLQRVKGKQALARGLVRSASVPNPSKMNKTEARYEQQLQLQKHEGEITDFWFEPMKLRVSPDFKGTYTPDFLVLRNDRTLLFVEVKGGLVREDAIAKFKAAAAMWPIFAWKMIQLQKGKWTEIYAYGEEAA